MHTYIANRVCYKHEHQQCRHRADASHEARDNSGVVLEPCPGCWVHAKVHQANKKPRYDSCCKRHASRQNFHRRQSNLWRAAETAADKDYNKESLRGAVAPPDDPPPTPTTLSSPFTSESSSSADSSSATTITHVSIPRPRSVLQAASKLARVVRLLKRDLQYSSTCA